MSDIEVFELDDDFDPLEDMGLALDDDVEEHDYLAPIPDAERSIVPEPAILTPDEKMQKLLAGTPGQKHRILRIVDLCEQPHTVAEIDAQLEAEFPQSGSVYDTGRLVQLLVEAQALARLEDEAGPAAATATEAGPESPEAESAAETEAAATPEAPAGGAYLEVAPPAPSCYLATDEGLAFAARTVGLDPIAEAITSEPRYLPIYQRILTMVSAEGGCSKKDLNAAVDNDELCQSPRLYTEYFLGRLEDAGAVHWNETWRATELGAAALASDIFEA